MLIKLTVVLTPTLSKLMMRQKARIYLGFTRIFYNYEA